MRTVGQLAGLQALVKVLAATDPVNRPTAAALPGHVFFAVVA